MEKRVSVNYNWNTFINDRAIIDFQQSSNRDFSELKLEHYYVASFIAQVYMRPEVYSKLITEEFYGEKYVYMSTHFFLRNLKLLNGQERTLKRILKRLEEFNFIDRVVVNKNQRFVKPNDEFIKFYRYDMYEDIGKEQLNRLVDKMGMIFGKTSKSQRGTIRKFCKTLPNFEHFEQQLQAYLSYKDYTRDHLHSFDKFITIWDEYDWDLLLRNRETKDEIKRFENFY